MEQVKFFLRFSCTSWLNLFAVNIIIITLFANSDFVQSHYSTGTFFKISAEGSALRGYVAERFSDLSLLECALNCERLLPTCKSFNYKERNDSSNVCEISTRSKDFAREQDFVKDGESIYGEVINTTEKADVPVFQNECERRNAASGIAVSIVANTITYSQANSTCHTQGKELCSAKQICCNETNPFDGVKPGDKWVPTSDGYNVWIQIGRWPHPPCRLHTQLPTKKPAWGTEAVRRNFKKYLFCCNP